MNFATFNITLKREARSFLYVIQQLGCQIEWASFSLDFSGRNLSSHLLFLQKSSVGVGNVSFKNLV